MQPRELTRFHTGLTEQVGECNQKVITILDRVFPKYGTFFSNVFIQSSRQLLAEALSPQEFAELDMSELSRLLQQASRERHGQGNAEEIQVLARRSVGMGFLTDALRSQMACLLQQLDLLESQRRELDAEIETMLADAPQFITSFPGVGPITGATILAEIGDVRRFDSSGKMVAYAGIDPTVYQGGQFEAKKPA